MRRVANEKGRAEALPILITTHHSSPITHHASFPQLPPVVRVDLIAAVGENEVHVIRLGRRGFHSRRAAWHARYRKATRFRALGEQPLDFLGRHMALDCVALHNRGVAAPQPIRDAVFRPIPVRVAYVFRLRTEAICPQMLDPRGAAPSGRALVDGNLWPARIIFRRASGQQ